MFNSLYEIAIGALQFYFDSIYKIFFMINLESQIYYCVSHRGQGKEIRIN